MLRRLLALTAVACAPALAGCADNVDRPARTLTFLTVDDRNISPQITASVAIPDGTTPVSNPTVDPVNRSSVLTLRTVRETCPVTITVSATAARRDARVDPMGEMASYQQARPQQRAIKVAGAQPPAAVAATISADVNVDGHDTPIARTVVTSPTDDRVLLSVLASAEPAQGAVCRETPNVDGRGELAELIGSLKLTVR